MIPFRPHLEVLPDAQRALWSLLVPTRELAFCLYGGTAVALHLGHRCSVDFDFFSHEPLDLRKEDALLQALPFLRTAQLIQKEPNTRSYITKGRVKLSFFGGIGFGRIGEPLDMPDGVLRVASIKDLMATKLAVVMQRVESKDYRDIAAILRSGVSLQEGLAGAAALYGMQFPPAECVRTLVYFQGGDLDDLPEEDKGTLRSAVRDLEIHQLPKSRVLSLSLV